MSIPILTFISFNDIIISKGGCEMNSIGERVKYLRKTLLHKSQYDFGKKIGLKANSISCIETGINIPAEQTIKSICREFNISYLWITQGVEPIYEQTDISSMARIDAIMCGENEFAKSLFQKLSNLDESEWSSLEKLVEKLFVKL